MIVWIVSCGLLFALVELVHWLQAWVVPLPFYILGGAILAIASNYEKGIAQYWQRSSSSETPTLQASSSPLLKSTQQKP